MTYTVEVRGLYKAFDATPVLAGVDLRVATGSVFALLGPNGAGKSTLIRILATLLRPDRGSACVAGHDLLDDPVAVRRAISLTGQHAAVDEVLTGRENLRMMGELLHLGRRAAAGRADELLAGFGLADAADRRVATYSGGMRRRLDLAAGLVVRPVLAFLDEPTTGLDPRSRDRLWSAVRGLVDDGVTVLLTTQYLEEADQLADRIAVLDGGRIVAEGTAGELKARLGDEVVRLTFASDRDYRCALGILAPDRTDPGARSVEVVTDGSAGVVLGLLDRLSRAGAPAATVRTDRPSLDDVFRTLTTEKAA